MKVKRAYVMRARAESSDATRRRILDAAVAELWGHRLSDVRLESIAARAEVTVQTVLRVFGSKSDLLDVAIEALRERIRRQRESAEPGDIEGTLAALFDHYEEMGDFVVRSLADEATVPELRDWLDAGRRVHRLSMRRQFAPQLAGHAGAERKERLDCLVAACDVYTWKLLRRDLGRSRQDAQACVRRTVIGILEA
jgi:AcrR family transcriptional regulator